jgi:tetratricopeptide (TPR) repeat protein
LRRWTSDAPYIARFAKAAPADLYRIYLDERASYPNSTAFFLDAADQLLEKGQTDLGLRVLSNLAELDLENRHILRILGYRLLQAGRPRLAIPVFQQVLELSPEEPQSYRDLGLAYAADKQYQKAVDSLNEVVIRAWHGRFPEIELIAVAELNAIAAEAQRANVKLDLARVDPRLLKNLPLDLRVVLTWDADNTDIDLWVMDPNGEKAYYGHRLTYQGGRVSPDFTGGYGPEEFSLRAAKPGKYTVLVNFYGHTVQTVAGATTLQVKFITGFGTARQRERIVTLRLRERAETFLVGEFEVAPGR